MSDHHGVDPEGLKRLTDIERREAEEILASLAAMRESDPLQFFKPHWKQHLLMIVVSALRAFLGGNRSGKTTVGIVDDLIQAIDRSAVPKHLAQYKYREPPFYCRICTPDFTSTMEGVIFQKLREWAPRDQLVGGTWAKAYDKANRILRFKNGSWFQFMTYEQDLDKFGGAALHRIHYDEEPPEGIRKECLMRLIDYGGDELFTMTPLEGMTWMYDDVWEKWESKVEPEDELHCVVVDMDDNPYLDEKTKKRALAGLSQEERRARKEGRFVHFGGLVYKDFDFERHVIPEVAVPEQGQPAPWLDQAVYVGIDPGQRHLAAAVYCATAADGAMTVFDEIALQGVTVADMAYAIKMTNAKWGIEPRFYIIDPAARNHMHQTGRSDQMEYADRGIITALGQNSVTAGINNVRTRLQFGGLSITANCTVLIDEFRKYRWVLREKKAAAEAKEAVIKKDDHLLDALRYVCMARPFVAKAEDSNVIDLPLYQRLVADQYKRSRAMPRLADGGPGRYL